MSQIGDFSAKIEKLIREAASQDRVKAIGERIIEIIKTRTRGEGKGTYGKLKPLADSTIDARRQKRLHPDTTPETSNLTETGQLLDSLTAKATSDNGLTIYFKGRRTDGKTNLEVAEAVSNARPFFELSANEQKQVTKEFQRSVDDLVKRSDT